MKLNLSSLSWLGCRRLGFGGGFVYPATVAARAGLDMTSVDADGRPMGRVGVGSGVPGIVRIANHAELQAAVAAARAGVGPTTIELPSELDCPELLEL